PRRGGSGRAAARAGVSYEPEPRRHEETQTVFEVPSLLEHESRLELEHPRRIDVRERRKRIRGGRDAHDLAERWTCRIRVPVNRLRTAEDVRVVEKIEALEPQEERAGSELDSTLRED